MKKIEKVRKILKAEYVDIHGEIDAILNEIKPWYLRPETIQTPIIVNIWGMTGTGKTSLIRWRGLQTRPAVLCPGDSKPYRAGRDLPTSRSTARSIPVQHHG